jgi:glycosyltransferase involved in cell wall biosynthesis
MAAGVFVTVHNMFGGGSHLRRHVWTIRLRILSRLNRLQLFVTSAWLRAALKAWVSTDFWNRISVTYPGINPENIHAVLSDGSGRLKMRDKLKIAHDTFVVLTVGQFVDRKGRWILLEAAKRLVRANQDTIFVWITPRFPDPVDLVRIDEYGLGDNFRLVESASIGTDHLSILNAFQMGDVFVLPSYVEGLPIALLEAMALGIPSISTPIEGIPEAIHDGETGLLVPAGEPGLLEAAILRLRTEPDLRRKLSTNGSNYVLETFDQRKTAARIMAAYEKCRVRDEQ